MVSRRLTRLHDLNPGKLKCKLISVAVRYSVDRAVALQDKNPGTESQSRDCMGQFHHSVGKSGVGYGYFHFCAIAILSVLLILSD